MTVTTTTTTLLPAPTSATTPTRSDSVPFVTERRLWSLPRVTVVAGLGTAAVTTAVAGALHAAGVPLAVGGAMIPLAGFAQLTFVGAVIGGVLLAVLNRRSNAPRHRFVQTTVVLTALSCVPSVALPPDAATKIALVSLHLLAAVIIIPALARHAHD